MCLLLEAKKPKSQKGQKYNCVKRRVYVSNIAESAIIATNHQNPRWIDNVHAQYATHMVHIAEISL